MRLLALLLLLVAPAAAAAQAGDDARAVQAPGGGEGSAPPAGASAAEPGEGGRGADEPTLDELEAESIAPAARPAPEELPPGAPPRSPGVLIKTIVGLVLLLALAYLGGHPVVRGWERRLGIAQVVTAGFPFLALGMIARHPSVGVLTDPVLAELALLLRLALGWIGFSVGFRFDVRALDEVPDGTARAVGFATVLPFATVVIGASALLLLTTGLERADLRDPIFLRDAFVLGTAGAITASSATRVILGAATPGWMPKVVRLEEIAGVVGLLFIAAYFRPSGEGVTWLLPGTAWLFLTVGMGVALGVVGYAMLRLPATGAESAVMLLGLLGLASGAASNLLLSPIVIGFVAGALLVNVPGGYKQQLGATLTRLERPIYLLFLVIVGAILEVEDWRGWVLLSIFVPARLFGKALGARLGWRTGEVGAGGRRWTLASLPMGSLSIAIVISAQLLYPQGLVPVIATAVIGGALVTELVVQLLLRALQRGTRT